jgi:4-amino-4-deoxy-L-arabinose transferase-like glycosyltransferase
MSLLTLSPSRQRKSPQRSSWKTVFQSTGDHTGTALLVLTLWCVLLFFYGLTAGELYRTESLRAIIAGEFLRSGNWVVPTLYGEPLFTKPPGMYAAIALVSWPVGGVQPWTARLPSALAASASVFLFYWYFSRQLGRLGGLLAGAVLPVSLMWLDKATAAEIDMMQVAWVSAAIICFLRALEIAEETSSAKQTIVLGYRLTMRGEIRHEAAPPSPSIRPQATGWFWWLAAMLCVAGGVLTKWTAPAFFYGTVVSLLWWRGRMRLLLGRQHLVSAALGAAVCLGWIGAAAALAGWRPFYDTVSREGLMRLLPSHHDRPYPWAETLLHPFKVLAAGMPITAIALLALRPGFAHLWDERGRRLLQALQCWLWPNLFFWTIIPEHAPRHSFPLLPALAGLAAMVWLAWLTGRQAWPLARWRLTARPARVLIGILAVWLVAKVVFVEVITPQRNQNREPCARGQQLATLVPEGKTLYLFDVKDEGIMFYYGRTVKRLASPVDLPSSSEPMYCILDGSEWRRWQSHCTAELVGELRDEQGEPMVLLRVPAGQQGFPPGKVPAEDRPYGHPLHPRR